ncbi:hypothetical protein H2509_05695 [Stappia sp. F7233]|uniref:Uncharacterized protein n=1 Tax=Stappia albiluteola TaxID=2758565 RepID=A0A839ABR5_9HYPH|nr:hypothetical protein [Stappia albiluteola]MBA5776616.1 hypothetical protein [Stappia albiluteola]
MKAFLAGLAAMAVIGVAAWAVLTKAYDYSSASVYTSANPGAVRLSPSDEAQKGG